MKAQRTRLALAIALLLAGCGTQAIPTANPTANTSDPLGLGDAIAPRYQTLSQQATSVSIAGVNASSTGAAIAAATASSVRDDRWFASSNLTDGNLHSAWGPAPDDASPTLTLSLAQTTRLNGLGIKMDAGATFDVQVACGHGWKTIATNVSPQYRALDFVSLTTTPAQQVRLVFHVQPNAKLLVCEVKLFSCGDTPSTAPSTTPSPTPTPAPLTCFDVTGTGDAVIRSDANGASYAFDDIGLSASSPKGTYTVTSNQGHEPILFTVTGIEVSGDTLVVLGTSAHATIHDTLTFRLTSRSATGFSAVLLDDTSVDSTGTTLDLDYTVPMLETVTVQGTAGVCLPPPCLSFTFSGLVIPANRESLPVILNIQANQSPQGSSGTMMLQNPLSPAPEAIADFGITSILDRNGEFTFTGNNSTGLTLVVTGFQDAARDGHPAGIVIDGLTVGSLGDVNPLQIFNLVPAPDSGSTITIGACATD